MYLLLLKIYCCYLSWLDRCSSNSILDPSPRVWPARSTLRLFRCQSFRDVAVTHSPNSISNETHQLSFFLFLFLSHSLFSFILCLSFRFQSPGEPCQIQDTQRFRDSPESCEYPGHVPKGPPQNRIGRHRCFPKTYRNTTECEIVNKQQGMHQVPSIYTLPGRRRNRGRLC